MFDIKYSEVRVLICICFLSQENQRIVGIKLTDNGEKLFEKVITYFDDLFSGLIERLGEEQSETLVDLLNQVCFYLNETTIKIES